MHLPLKHNAVIFILIILLAACTPQSSDELAATILFPTNTTTPVNTQPTQPSGEKPTQIAPTAIDLSGYALIYDERSCPLKEVDFYDLYVFQADCEEPIYIPQGTLIDLTFETPESEPLSISPVADLEAIFGALEPPFVFCQFDSVSPGNTITFGSPFQQHTGRDILCGFSVPLQGEEVIIVLTGLTTR